MTRQSAKAIALKAAIGMHARSVVWPHSSAWLVDGMQVRPDARLRDLMRTERRLHTAEQERREAQARMDPLASRLFLFEEEMRDELLKARRHAFWATWPEPDRLNFSGDLYPLTHTV